MLILTGCNSLTPSLTASPERDSNIAQFETEPGQQSTPGHLDPHQGLLDLADHALKRQHLTQPEATSALTYFNLILNTDPDHQAARAGLKSIIDQYLEWALRAIEAAHYAKANQYLERAARVNPKSSEIAAVADRLRRKREEGLHTEIFPDWLLTDRNAAVQSPEKTAQTSAYLRALARRIETLGAKVTIYSHNDAEGRWLYQQLNANTTDRLRGTLKIDAPSRIEMHFQTKPSTIPVRTPPSGLVAPS